MLEETLTHQKDADEITPAQVKAIIDHILAESHFNDEYVTVECDIEKQPGWVPIDHQILSWIHFAKTQRAALVKNDFSSREFKEAIEELQETSKKIGIPIEPGSISEKIAAREFMRELANYFVREAYRECQERDLPPPTDLEAMSAQTLKDLLHASYKNSPVFNRHAKTNTDTTDEKKNENTKNRRLDKLSNASTPQLRLLFGRPASELWAHYLEYRKTIQKKKETKNKLTSSLTLWNGLHKDLPVNQWTHAQAEALCRLFLDLPCDYAQSKKWHAYENDIEAIRTAYQTEIENANDEDRLRLKENGVSNTTWNRHHSTLSKFWQWAKLNGLTSVPTNPFDGLWINPTEDDAVADGGSEKRYPWPKNKLRLLFTSPLYMGCKSPYQRHLPGEYVQGMPFIGSH